MTYIKNRNQLLSHGRTALRQKALEIIEYALAQADPYRATRTRVHLNGDLLTVDEAVFETGPPAPDLCHGRRQGDLSHRGGPGRHPG